MVAILLQLYKKKKAQHKHSSEITEVNIMALMVKHNMQCEENGQPAEMIPESDIPGNILIIIFAAVDTSYETTASLITVLMT